MKNDDITNKFLSLNEKGDFIEFLLKVDETIKEIDTAVPNDILLKFKNSSINSATFVSIYYKNGVMKIADVVKESTLVFLKTLKRKTMKERKLSRNWNNVSSVIINFPDSSIHKIVIKAGNGKKYSFKNNDEIIVSDETDTFQLDAIDELGFIENVKITFKNNK